MKSTFKTFKAPKGFHFMKKKTTYSLMKNKYGRFKTHKGASKSIKFKVIKSHRS
tara:strand:- start:736 stop:897 length:162 start_codon:yes stop_codon:yes gene_type:complete